MNFIIYILYIKFALIFCYLQHLNFHASVKLDDEEILPFYSEGDETENTKYFIRIKQFSKDDGSYFVYISNNHHDMYDSFGDSVFEIPISNNLYNHLYSLVPYSHFKDELYYYIIYFNNATQITFKKYSYNFADDIFKNESFYSNNILGNEINLITCQLMKNSNEKVISCFFVTHLENEYFINCTVFKPEEDFKVFLTSKIKVEAMSFYRIESEVLLDDERQKALIILSISDNEKDCLFYAGYNIHSNNFTYGYLIENNCSLYNGDNYYIGISYFKETEEFLVSSLRQCTFNNNTSQLNYLIYSFDNNFTHSFFGILGNLVLGDSCCKTETFIIYGNSYHSIFFDPYTRKYFIILNVNTPCVIVFIIINKEINIVNPKELESFVSFDEYICENYSIYYNENCTDNMSFLEDFKRLSKRKYLEKCTDDLSYIESNFECDNYIYTFFEFPIECSEEYPYEMVYTHECVKFCDKYDLSRGNCRLNYKNFNNINITEKITDIDSSEIINKYLIINSDYQTNNIIINTNTYEDIINPLSEQKIKDLLKIIFKEKEINKINLIEDFFSDTLFNNKINDVLNGGKDMIIKDNQTIIQITSTDNQKNNKNHNISTINLRECEKITKNIYNIDGNKSLLILKIDSFIAGSIIPIIQYEVYHPDNKSKLDLSSCKNKIEINIPVVIDENNLYKYEPKSDYYNDRCYTNTSDKEKDKPIGSRRKEFVNNNLALCETECEYKGYDFETKNSKCECKIKNEISIFNIKIDTERLYNEFAGLRSSNIDIIKCYYLLFKKENYIYNIGFYIILSIILLFCIDVIMFIFKGYNSLVKIIDILIKNIQQLRDRQLKTKTNMKKRRRIIKRKIKSKKKNNNPPIKKENNKIRNQKEKNKELDLNNESKSIKKLNSKNNESSLEKINNKEKKMNKRIMRRKRRTSIIKKSQLVTDVAFPKNNSVINSKIYLNDYELNRLEYQDAIKYDKRIYMEYYWSLLKIGDLFLFSFVRNNDYNSMIIKISLFFFSFSLYYTVNALFYTDSTMNKIYKDNGQYDFIYQIPKILYSNLICTIINLIVRFLSLSEKDILSIKIMREGENLEKKVMNIKKCLKIKFIFYYFVSFFLLFIFLFYISCFCVVYKKTQIYLIKDTLISFSLSLLYPLGYYLLPGIIRLPALKNNKREYLYKISLLLQSL